MREASDIASTTHGGQQTPRDQSTPIERSMLATTWPQPLMQLGHFRILRVLGRGGMGIVYLAVDEKLQRNIALKTMLPEAAADPALRERFLREARAAAKISSDYVVTVHSADEVDGIPYIAQQYLEGCTLDEFLKATPRLPYSQIVRFAREICQGLSDAHKLGLIHRDIKPSNLWVEGDQQRIKILDFGLARARFNTVELTQTGDAIGTPAYMSPEQARGDRLDERSDLFSVGVVLYRLCSGQLPFPGRSVLEVLSALANDEPTPLHQLDSTIPRDLAKIVERLLAKKPGDRYATSQSVLADLTQVSASVNGDPLNSIRAENTDAVTSNSKRRFWMIVAAAGGLVVLAALIATLTWHRAPETTEKAASQLVTVNPAENDRRSVPEFVAARKRIAEVASENTPSRVSIRYEIVAADSIELFSPPFVIGVLANLGGHEPVRYPLRDRKFITIDRDNIDDVMSRMSPVLQLSVPDRLGNSALREVKLTFQSLQQLHPEEVAKQIPELARLLDQKDDALAKTPMSTSRIQAIDQRLSSQLREVFQHPDFRRFEATWRSLANLVQRTETSPGLRVRVLDVRKAELMDDVLAANDSNETEAFRHIFDVEYGVPGGEPYGLLIGDFEIGAQVDETFLLHSMGKVAAFAGAPLILAPSPELFGIKDWHELKRDQNLTTRAAEPAWTAFRESPEARFVALALPRVLVRLPYTATLNEVDRFRFEELFHPPTEADASALRANELLWTSSSWVIAAEVASKIARYDWPARISGEFGGGELDQMPVRVFSDTALKALEVELTHRQQLQLAQLGFMPIDVGDGSKPPMLLRAQSCSEDIQLNGVLCASAFLRVLRMVARDKVGAFSSLEDFNKYCSAWLQTYCADADSLSTDDQAMRPLASASVEITEGKTVDRFVLHLKVRPRYQFGKAAKEIEFTVPLLATRRNGNTE
jgi:type VI secretion system ImpC/EvpB family protein